MRAAAKPTRSRGTRDDNDAIGIVGLGLIGGSLAKALRSRYPRRPLVGVERNATARAAARRAALFDSLSAFPTTALARCEIVVLAVPVAEVLRLLRGVSARMRDGAVLTDVSGVKQPVLEAARDQVRPGVAFVGGHPMFGGEASGFAASRAELWRGGTVAICAADADQRAVSRVTRLHRLLGARVVLCSAADHDAAVAAVSHLPYVLAAALALTAREAGPTALRLAARGLADTTRLAAFGYDVQGEAARRNRHLARTARAFRDHLHRLLDALATSPKAARAALGRVRAVRRRLVSPRRRRPR